MRKVECDYLLNAVVATGAGQVKIPWGYRRVFQVFGSVASGSGAATIKIQASNFPNADTDANARFEDVATFTLILGTVVVGDFVSLNESWKYVRANCTALSGTGAAVTALIGNALEG